MRAHHIFQTRPYLIVSAAFALLAGHCSSQTLISGTVIDTLTHESLAYVNIGIKNKHIGTTSLSDGSFTIMIPPGHENDSLTFSLIGYSDLKISVRDPAQKLIPLVPNPRHLQEVVVATSKLQEKKFGLKKRNPAIHFIDASMNQDDIFEIAQRIRLPETNSKLTSLNLYISEHNDDTVRFRINFYTYNGHHPAGRINERPLWHKKPLKQGWLHCDISELNLYAKKEIVAAIEFMPSGKRKKPVSYEIKLGSRTKSFCRSSSQGEWATPVHHYLMYLTALVPPQTSEENDAEKETPASAKIFSRFIQDSFSLFIHLPKNYSKHKDKSYPVVFLLDANAFFEMLSDHLEHKSGLPDLILVGIGYRNAYEMDSLRERDYTFPASLPVDSCKYCGGGDKFREFILQELIPFTQKNYRTSPGEVTLMGHSLGGYFPAWSLMKDLRENNTAIKNYICLSPSLDYAHYALMEEFKTIERTQSASKQLYVCYGDKEEEITDLRAKIILLTFEAQLKILGMNYQWDTFPSLSHMETPAPGFEQGLRAVFKN